MAKLICHAINTIYSKHTRQIQKKNSFKLYVLHFFFCTFSLIRGKKKTNMTLNAIHPEEGQLKCNIDAYIFQEDSESPWKLSFRYNILVLWVTNTSRSRGNGTHYCYKLGSIYEHFKYHI
ncbi:hypothetical protein AAZV13_10G140000 [Glycine max]